MHATLTQAKLSFLYTNNAKYTQTCITCETFTVQSQYLHPIGHCLVQTEKAPSTLSLAAFFISTLSLHYAIHLLHLSYANVVCLNVVLHKLWQENPVKTHT